MSEHERLGHVVANKVCEACNLGKKTRPTSKNEIQRTNNFLEELSVDPMGPITPISLGGSRYVGVIVDSATRFTWVTHLESKRGAVKAIVEIIIQAESQHESCV